MAFGKTLKSLIGIEDDENEIDDITNEEIDLEMKRMGGYREPEPVKPVSSTIEKPMTGISQMDDNPYKIVEPMMNAKKPEKRASVNSSGPFKMVVIEPKNFDECSKLVDNLKSRKPIIVNLEKVETDLARKMFDFLSGATYALNGNVQRVTQNIFIFAPDNVNINAQLNRDNTEAGYANNNNNNPWR